MSELIKNNNNLVKLFVGVCIALLLFKLLNKEEDDEEYGYNYPQENQNALQHGKIIGGTVYSDYPNKTPGLGWIL
jgi:hypothetical protein